MDDAGPIPRRRCADGVGRILESITNGFWFALGHPSVVVLLAALVAGDALLANTLTDRGSGTHQTLGVISVTVSGTFLYVIAALNLIALVGILRVFTAMRAGRYDEAGLEAHLDSRGFMNRILGRLTKSITRPGQMYPIGSCSASASIPPPRSRSWSWPAAAPPD